MVLIQLNVEIQIESQFLGGIHGIGLLFPADSGKRFGQFFPFDPPDVQNQRQLGLVVTIKGGDSISSFSKFRKTVTFFHLPDKQLTVILVLSC